MSDASKPEAAVREFTRAQRRTVSCVSTQFVGTPVPVIRPDERQLLGFARGPASLRGVGGGPSGLLLDVRQQIVVVPGDGRQWRVELRMYAYRILDYQERELLVYHWQPGPGFRGPDHPHVHVSAALRVQTNTITTRLFDLDKRHLATGQVSLAMVVRMLIEEFGVAPLRPDWQDVLDRSDQIAG